MTIDFVTLLHQSDSLLLFVVLAFGLLLGKVRIGNFQIGNTIGVLFTALLFGQMGFEFAATTENVGFMLFIFCVGIEAGPHFFSVFLRDGIHYITLTLVILLTALLLTVGLAKFFNLGPGMAAGILAGSLTSTPALVGAQDALRSGLLNLPHQTDMQAVLDNMGIGYALTYLVGLVGLMLVVRYLPSLARLDLNTEAQKIARERGLSDSESRKTYLPIIRAYRVGPELAAWIGGRTLRETGIYPHTGCYVERIRRNGILASPDGDAVIQEGDEIALVGYPESHEKLDVNYRNGKEVFDRNLLDLQIVTEEIVVKNDSVVGRHLVELNLTEKGCFLNRVVRSQIEMPFDRNIMLQKGDVLQISGEKQRVKLLANKIGFISIHSQTTDSGGLHHLLRTRSADRLRFAGVRSDRIRSRQRRRPTAGGHSYGLPAGQPPDGRLCAARRAQIGQGSRSGGLYGEHGPESRWRHPRPPQRGGYGSALLRHAGDHLAGAGRLSVRGLGAQDEPGAAARCHHWCPLLVPRRWMWSTRQPTAPFRRSDMPVPMRWPT